ncbi:MAG TPA: 4-carboxymuconolactone decarboxylase [Galbitalea sp.]|jgi:3-oxoadipate enol-lactonase/4-carboxymuconolactone decarboxylase|nr:4-carboxymuconolactone decarboxylase [Galbitalea sp.]
MTVPTLRCSVLPVREPSEAARLIVLGPSLGTTSEIWDVVAGRLAETYRVLRFDLPGHGFSPAATSSFTVSDLATAVLDLVDSVGGGSFYYAGDSLGGAIGLTLAAEHPDRVLALIAFAAGATFGTPDGWTARAKQVRASGTASVVALSAGRWFAPGYLDRDPGPGAAALDHLLVVDDESYALCCDALADYDLTEAAWSIRVPTLCVAGEFDVASPPSEVKALAHLIPSARYLVIPGAGHLPVTETPAEAEQAIRGMLPPERTYEAGMIVRRAVLGDAHVDAANSRITPETADFQEFLTRYAWGEVWARPGLSHRDRSLVTLASLVTGGHDNEIAMHVRAALTNGVTREEISEIILHTSLYAGLPGANAAFAIARSVFAELDDEN